MAAAHRMPQGRDCPPEMALHREGNLFLPDSKAGPRTVWLSSAALTILDGLPRTATWVFPSPQTDSSLTVMTVGRVWYRVRVEADLCDVRLHDLRHSYASMALAQGETVLTIGRLLGHRDPATTLKYTQQSDPMVREAVDAVGHVLDRQSDIAYSRFQEGTMPATATLHAKQALTEAGISDAHAGAIVAMTRDALTEGIATKTDIADLKTDMVHLNGRIENIATQLDARIENTAIQLRGEFREDLAQLGGEFKAETAQLDARIENTAAQLDAKIENTAIQLRGEFRKDLAQLGGEFKAETAQLDARIENTAAQLDAKISKLESNMLRLAIGIVLAIIVANTALTATLIKLL